MHVTIDDLLSMAALLEQEPSLGLRNAAMAFVIVTMAVWTLTLYATRGAMTS